MPKSRQPPSDRPQARKRSTPHKLSRQDQILLIEIAVGHLKYDRLDAYIQWHKMSHEVESQQECPICLAAQQIYETLRSLSVLPLGSVSTPANLDTYISEILNKHVGHPVRGSSAARKKTSTVDITDEMGFNVNMDTRWSWLIENATTPKEMAELRAYERKYGKPFVI